MAIRPDTIQDAVTLLREGQLSAVELVDFYLERIRQLNPELNAFLYIAEEMARAEAREADKRLAHGEAFLPLHGIPLGIKDLIDVAGMTMTAGSQFFKDNVPAHDAAIIQNLKASGAIIIGKTHLQEFAFSSTQPNRTYGPARNPWNTELSPGGTSGGSGVAVSAGMCAGALGSDTGGSVRLPAAMCGLTGLRPAAGVLDMQGVFPRSKTLDAVGPMAHTAEDVAILYDAMVGRDTPTDYVGQINGSVNGLRIGVPTTDYFWQGAEEEILVCVQAALETLEDMGLSRVDVSISTVQDGIDAVKVLGTAEALDVHADRLARQPDQFSDYVRERLLAAKAFTEEDRQQARQSMSRWQAELKTILTEQVDLFVTPTTPVATHPIGPSRPMSAPNYLPRFVYPISASGLPSLSLPCGFTSDGIPVGMQFVGAEPGVLLLVAHAYQQRTDWHRRRPVLDA